MSQALNAGDFCNRNVVVASCGLSVVEAARLMRAQFVGSLVVVDELPDGRRPVGMLTDRDIVTAVVAKEVDPATLSVEDLMSTDIATASETDSMTDMPEIQAEQLNLEAAVGRGRVGCDAVGWQGETTLRADARKEEQRSQRVVAWRNRPRSVLTQQVNMVVSTNLSVHAV